MTKSGWTLEDAPFSFPPLLTVTTSPTNQLKND
jgi:hypothetical protein